MSSIDVLQRENRDKALKIAGLESIIRKLNGQLKEKDQKVQSLESLLKERTNKINKLNVEFFRMEQELIEFKKMKEIFVEQESRIEELQEIITLQGEEIESYMKDQQHYVRFVEDMYESNQGWFEERGLLHEYKEELERQVNQVEEVNEKLIMRNGEYEGELQQQNEQGNDLLGQIQYMIECCEGVE